MPNKYLGRLLLVDDDAETIKFWSSALGHEGFLVDGVQNLEEMREKLKSYSFDAVLLDLELEKESGLNGLPILAAEAPFVKVFILTGHASIDTAVTAMAKGASDYVSKNMTPKEIAARITCKLRDDHPVHPGKSKEILERHGLIGTSKVFLELCATIEKLKDVDSTILIMGESGTGKEVIARTIHALSNRSTKRFEAINCAAIPENLLESELFGHRRGAFTDAKGDRKGIFELCSDGFFLLDEIGDMPQSLQSKLLRVLQEKVIVPVGSATSIKINTRVLAATHRDLIEEIQSGRFREDLYFRLSVVPLQVPPLRHRKEDIPLLVNYFVKNFNAQFNKSIEYPSPEIMNRLVAYDWPGNIRELRNAIERAVVLSTDQQLAITDIFHHLHKLGVQRPKQEFNSGISQFDALFELPLSEAKQAFEKSYIERFLQANNGNVSEVAKKSGRYRIDIYRLIEKYGFNPNDYR